MNKIKIIFLMPHIIIGGIEKTLQRILREMSRNPEYEISVVSRGAVLSYFYDFCIANNINLKQCEFNCDNYVKSHPMQRFFVLKKIWKMRMNKQRRKNFPSKFINAHDIVVDFFNGSFHRDIKKYKGKKILWEHSCLSAANKSGYMRHLSRYDYFVCVSDSFLTEFRKQHKDIKSMRIYNALDKDEVEKLSKTGETLPSGKKYFISCARTHADKDYDTLIGAFAKFADGKDDIKLLVCGTGPLLEKVIADVWNKKIQDKVIFRGDAENPFGYMKNSLALILSTNGEGMGAVLPESAAAGTLAIACDVESGVREALLNGRGGILFPHKDSDALARIMRDVYDGKIVREEYISNARAGLERFDVKKIVFEIDMLFNEILGMKKPKISVIIPVYKAEEYLRLCLDSVRNQTMADFECIMVDDKSPDSSGAIMDEYASADKRFIAVHCEKNGGPSLARNIGIERATGEYIAFFDNDDYADGNYLETMYNLCKEHGADVGCADVAIFYECDTENQRCDNWIHNNSWRSDKTIRSTAQERYDLAGSYVVWNKIYRREFVMKNKLRLPVGKLADDFPFSFFAVALANKIAMTKDTAMHHRERKTGIMNSSGDRFALDAIDSCKMMMKKPVERKIKQMLVAFFLQTFHALLFNGIKDEAIRNRFFDDWQKFYKKHDLRKNSFVIPFYKQTYDNLLKSRNYDELRRMTFPEKYKG